MAVPSPEQKPAAQAPSTSPPPSPAAPPPAASSAPIGGGVAFAPVNQRTLAEIDKYYRAFDPTLPKLEWKDKDGDGRIDLFDRLGNEYDSENREVPVEWAHLLRSVAVDHHETKGGGVELSSADWATHEASLKSQAKSGRVVLPNGLTVIAEYDETQPYSTIGYFVEAGSGDEIGPQGKEREHHIVAHLAEHMHVGENRAAFKQNLINLGGGIEPDAISTEGEGTLYSSYVKPGDGREEKAFLMWDEVLTNGTYNPDRLRAEMKPGGILNQEISQYRSDPESSARRIFMLGLYPDHPIGQPVSSAFDQVKDVTLPELQAYHNNNYVPNNVAIKFYGKVTIQEAVNVAQKSRIGKMHSSPVRRPTHSLRPSPSEPTLDIVPSGTQTMPFTKTTEVRIGWRTPDRTNVSDSGALDVALSLINDRLDQALVKTGRLNKAIIQFGQLSSSGYYEDAIGVGVITLALSGDVKKMQEAMVEAQMIIEQVKRYPPSDLEVESARRKMIAQDAVRQEKAQQHITQPLSRVRHADPVAERKAWLERIPSVNAQAIQSVTREYLGTVGSHTLVVLQEASQDAAGTPGFPTPQELLNRMKAVVTGTVSPPAEIPKERPVYPKTKPAKDLQLESLLKKKVEKLPDGRERYYLKNGIVVTYVPTKGGRVSMQIRSPLGIDTDFPGKEGTRALDRENMFRGTNVLSSEDFAREMNFLGAAYGCNNNPDSTSISLTTSKEGFADASQLLLYAIQNPRLSDKDLKETKALINQARQSLENDSAYIATAIPAAALYPNHRMMRPVLGTDSTVTQIDRNDLKINRQRLLDTTKLKVTIGGSFENSADLNQVLYALSRITSYPRASAVEVVESNKNATKNATIRNSFQVVTVSDPAMLTSLGAKGSQITVTHTPRTFPTAYVSQQMLGPRRDSADYAYFYAFKEVLGPRVNRAFIYGIRGERQSQLKENLYFANARDRVIEMSGPALIWYEFKSQPAQISGALAEFRDVYYDAIGEIKNGKGRITQQELKEAIEDYRIYLLKPRETTPGQVSSSILMDERPWYFKNQDGSIDKITDPNVICDRLAALPIADVIKIGAPFFNPNKPSWVHIVGSLPDQKSN